jgi:hypothetical protein
VSTRRDVLESKKGYTCCFKRFDKLFGGLFFEGKAPEFSSIQCRIDPPSNEKSHGTFIFNPFEKLWGP